jgi:hypothetical protein
MKQPKDADIYEEQPGTSPVNIPHRDTSKELFLKANLPTKEESKVADQTQNENHINIKPKRLTRHLRIYPDNSSQQDNNNPFQKLLNSQERNDTPVIPSQSQHSHNKINEAPKPEHKRLRITPVNMNHEPSGENPKKKSHRDTRKERHQVMKIEWY